MLCLPVFNFVVTTSPQLADHLIFRGLPSKRIIILPCSLDCKLESSYLSLPNLNLSSGVPLHVLFIGRLDSYKRLDLLFLALNHVKSPWILTVVGDGPYRYMFEQLADDLFSLHPDHFVLFRGRLSEQHKISCVADSHVLVLPSDRSNEAFGIVQLEAMAAGRPSLAFNHPRSGMGWVGKVPALSWSQSFDGLASVLQRLADNPAMLQHVGQQSRERYLQFFSRSVWLQSALDIGDSRSTQ